ncbi:MAG: succinate dehydrogenase [Chlamydiia bacterium]|nr:succinate dehydrogenase [Chlamydiia bacterium]
MLTASKAPPLPRAFIWRRLHSLFGLWLAIFLFEHLLTNSQAALFIGDSGHGFIYYVNILKNLPYLPVIEIGLLGIPILMHGVWGIQYILKGKANSGSSDGSKPTTKEFGRSHAYTWQRYTAWILLFGIIAHVSFMRFYLYPNVVNEGAQSYYFVRVGVDPGLYTVASRLDVQLYDQKQIDEKQMQLNESPSTGSDNNPSIQAQDSHFQQEYLQALKKRPIDQDQVIAVADNFGTATLLTVRDSFRKPITCALYTIFVLAAVFHAYNGLWTFMITWGIVLRMRSQKKAVNVCIGIMCVMAFLGLAAIWGTYFVNLRT